MDSPSIESFGQVRVLVEDLFHIRPAVYWIDFLTTIGIAWTAFSGSVWELHHGSSLYWLGLAISALAFYRGLIFIHEIIHVRSVELSAFTVVWNTLCGFFIFVPTYTYLCHASHHRVTSFSTKGDPEYLPLSYQKPFQVLSPFIIFPLFPFILALRFLVLGPISLVVGGRFRAWILRYASSLKMNIAYEWVTVTPAEKRLSVIQDIACFLWWGLFLGACAYAGILASALIIWVLLAYFILCINHFRSLAAHRYINFNGVRVSYEDQLLDSITITGFSPGATLLTPIGLRYHSLHHMFPTMPYHALPTAHRRLMEALPKTICTTRHWCRRFISA